MKGAIREQKDLAKILNHGESSISRAVKGVEGYGDGVIKKLTKKFPELNYDYLMINEGDLLLADEDSRASVDGKTKEYYMAKYIESLETINSQKDEISQLDKEIARLNDLIAQLSDGSAGTKSVKAG